MPHKPNLTVYISNLPALRRVAQGLGCTLTTGPRAGEGSVREMLEYISRGEIVCVFKDDMLRLADELRKLADNLDRQDAAISLRALAAALRLAAEIKKD